MTKFINLDLNEPIHWKFLTKHILYSIIWLLFTIIFIFRLDLDLREHIPTDYQWIIKTVPIIFIILVLVLMFKSKWYYNLVLIFYPFVIIFWFLPKFILRNGKIYLLTNYISSIYNRLRKFKKSLIQFGIFILTIYTLIITDSNIFRIISMVIMTFFYYTFLIKYIKSSFRPAQLFGEKIEKAIDEFLNTPEKKLSLVEIIEKGSKKDKKLPEEERKMKKLKSLIVFNFLIETISYNLKGFRGKKAFIISWMYQLIAFLIISLLYFTFINFELYVVDTANFQTIGNPNIFDFVYYTIKTIIYNNTLKIIPIAPLSQIVETLTFFTLGIFLLVFVTSIIFTLKQDRINENVKKATDLCLYQNQAIVEHIKVNYQTDIATVLKETTNIKKSLDKIKKSIEKIF